MVEGDTENYEPINEPINEPISLLNYHINEIYQIIQDFPGISRSELDKRGQMSLESLKREIRIIKENEYTQSVLILQNRFQRF